MKYKCEICEYIYDEDKEGALFDELPESWVCADCFVPKSFFKLVELEESQPTQTKTIEKDDEYDDDCVYVKVNDDCHSIARNSYLCVNCGNCKNICKNQQAVCGYFNPKKIKNNTICIDCGQCTLSCPTGAINYKNDIMHVKNAISDSDKIVIFQTAPSVRASVSEEFGLNAGTLCEGKVVAALRKLGANYVFDTTFGADLTIMEEASELVDRIQTKQALPLMTSCCPAWVKFAEIFYPELLPNLSSAKSPILMQGAIIKTYFAKKMNILPEKIVTVAITPCTAKKAEIKRSEMNASAMYNNDTSLMDMDYVLTVREFAKWLKDENINFDTLSEENYDDPLGRASGAGVIFGNSGGVMEAALRTANFLLTGKNLDKVEFQEVRGLGGIKEATVKIGDTSLKVAVVAGTANARELISKIQQGEKYDFVEVMACPGGCISGGGQPKSNTTYLEEAYKARQKGLYSFDPKSKTRFCHENEDIKKLYSQFLGKPLSPLSESLLHTSYFDKSEILGD